MRLTSLLTVSVSVALATTAAAQLSINAALPGSFVDISGTGTPLSLSDDGEIDIFTTVGNALLPAGTVRVGSNGAVRFNGAGQGLGFGNGAIPSTNAFSGDQTLMPFWDDINTVSGAAGEIYWQQMGGMLIIQWHNAEFFAGVGDTVTFQIQVPSTGTTWARYVYADVMQARPDGGGSATIGYQAGGWGNDVAFSFNTSAAVSDNDVLSIVGTFTPPMPPANDDCANAVIAPLGATAFDSNFAATSAPAFSCGVGGGADVWFKYTATSANNVRVETCGSSFDTVLEIYTGSCAALVSVDCGDNDCGVQSVVTATGVTAGTDYYIRVGGVNGVDGTGTITITEIVPPLPLQIVDNISGTWVDISATGVPLSLCDDCLVDVVTTIGNNVLAAGTVRVSANGAIRFGGTGQGLTFTNAGIPSTNAFGGDQTLMPFWDDFNMSSGAAGELYVQEIGGVLIFQWEDAEFFSGGGDTARFQVQVFGGTGPVVAQYLYQSVDSIRADNGGSATIGYQGGLAGFSDFEWSFNLPGAVANGDVLTVVAGPGGVGTNYCMANANSTGVPGVMSATGSAGVAANDMTIVASDLPLGSFGFFIVSDVQGFVPGPGGSAGNLCLGGQIGRYVGPGQIQNTGGTGEISLLVNNQQIPSPTGFFAVMAGDVLNFQCWHRDVGMPATSNFSDGLEVTFTN